MRLLILVIFSLLCNISSAKVLHTGHGQPYADIAIAAKAAAAGDTILVHTGTPDQQN